MRIWFKFECPLKVPLGLTMTTKPNITCTYFRECFKALFAVNTLEGLVILTVCRLMLRQLLRRVKCTIAHVTRE